VGDLEKATLSFPLRLKALLLLLKWSIGSTEGRKSKRSGCLSF
jgi:hypothetical protein